MLMERETMGGVTEERRKYRRLDVRTEVLCKKVDSECCRSFKANSINVSTEGILAEMNHHHVEINDGELFGLEMDVPAGDNADFFGGKLLAYGKVVRVVQHHQSQTGKRHIAFQFCTRPMYEM
jgi:hypothetical protein